ncbi:MAG: hypothetical protein ACR2RL_21615 [Gammaproteobacteria bacterium]
MSEHERRQRLAYWRERILSHLGREADTRTVIEYMASWLVCANWEAQQWERRARRAGWREPEPMIAPRAAP